MSGRRRIGPVDTIWLNMDRPNNLMVIEGLMFLESPPEWDRLRDVIQTRLVDLFPVFHQRPVPPRTPLGLPHWEDDPEFSIDRHLHRFTLPPPGDDGPLQAYVEDHLHVAFDRQHPLWEMHLIEGYGDGAVVMTRFHHALADGIALTRVLLSLTDETPTADLEGAPAPATVEEVHPQGLTQGLAGALGALGSVGAVADTAVSATFSVARLGVEQAGRLTTVGGIRDALDMTVRTGRVVQQLLFIHNPENALGGDPGARKRAVWSPPYPLPDLKHVGRLAGATLNDVLLSAVAGAVNRYLVDQGEAPTDLTTMVPVNVRPLDKPLPPELGNRFALVYFTFPSSLSAPLARLAETKRRMDWLKSSPEALVTFGLIMMIGRTAAELERLLVNFFANKALGVTTNVAGPPTVRYLAGTKVAGILGWVPGSGRQTVGVCIFTYNNTVRVGFMVDAQRVPDPEKLLNAFDAEVEELMHLSHAM